MAIGVPKYDRATVYAVRALHQGTANESQQKLVFEWIVHELARISDVSFREGGPEGDRMTAFAEGRRFVGLQMAKMLQPEVIKALDAQETKKGGTRRTNTRGKP